MSERPFRMCDVCGGVDDHPRHVFACAEGECLIDDEIALLALTNAGEQHSRAILAQIRDTATSIRHMDCCAQAGCPDGSCETILQSAGDKRGQALVNYLTEGN